MATDGKRRRQRDRRRRREAKKNPLMCPSCGRGANGSTTVCVDCGDELITKQEHWNIVDGKNVEVL